MRFVTRFFPSLAGITIAGTAAACSSDTTGPGNPGDGGTTASAVVTVDSAVGAGTAARIEIELFPGELVAREVHVESDDAEEKIVSVVTAIDPAQGTLTLELGGLAVSYGSGTRFRTETESHEDRATWEALVQRDIAAGRRPLIEARRTPAGAPQSPEDASFTAADLRLEGESDEPKIEIYVDRDNLVSGDGTSEVVLRVLGHSITVNGRTSLGPDDNGGTGQPSGSVEFEMGVASLDATATAAAQGRPVRAEGRGSVESAGAPTVIEATTLKIEVDD